MSSLKPNSHALKRLGSRCRTKHLHVIVMRKQIKLEGPPPIGSNHQSAGFKWGHGTFGLCTKNMKICKCNGKDATELDEGSPVPQFSFELLADTLVLIIQ